MKFRRKVELTPDESITQLVAGHNRLMLATKDKRIAVIDTSDSNAETDCDLKQYLGNRLHQSRLYKLFLDPTGQFCLISLAYAKDNQPLENLLFVERIQALPKLKGHLISAVAWNYPRAEHETYPNNSTGTILIGTTKGLVFQTELVHSDETKFFPLGPGSRHYVKEVFDIGTEVGAITGLEYHQIPSVSSAERNFVILVSTSNRLYRMVGTVPANLDPPPLHLIFAQYSSIYRDVPGRFNHAKLDLFYPALNAPPIRFAWLTEPGVLTGELYNQLSTCKSFFKSNEDICIVPYNVVRADEQLLSTSTPSGMSPPFVSFVSNYQEKPISVIATNFHVIILFRYCIKVLCVLNDATIYEEYLSPKYGNILGMCKDPIKNIIWVYQEKAVIRYKISSENKNIWKIYLEQQKFDLAKKYSRNDPNNYDRVLCEEAQYHFREKDYVKSAEIFARSKESFENVSLMFMDIKNYKALKKYLLMKLEQFDSLQMTQLLMTLAWLLEIIMSSISVIQALPETNDNLKELNDLFTELEQLLENSQVIACLKQYSKVFYGIIIGYQDLELFVKVAKLIGDFDRVVQYYINVGEFRKALDIMRAMKKNEFFYTYGHILMKRMPHELVDALIELPNINPSKLIPVLLQDNPYFNKCSETIRYLEYCVKVLKSDSAVVHNYLFELYARHRDESVLIEFLEYELYSDGSQQQQQQHYLDLQLCLRLCTELKLLRTCVTLYSAMRLYDEAVILALEFDVELAKRIARKVDSDDHQKRLWLNIAQNVLTQNLDIQTATNLLAECRLLKIEDILHFFPDQTTVDFFRDAIRKSLNEYKEKIRELKDGYDSIADQIRGDIKAFRNRYSIIRPAQKCEICSKNLLYHTFFLFPCGHLFHSECMLKEALSIDPDYKLEELEHRVCKECLYCGSLLIDYIQKPPQIEND